MNNVMSLLQADEGLANGTDASESQAVVEGAVQEALTLAAEVSFLL